MDDRENLSHLAELIVPEVITCVNLQKNCCTACLDQDLVEYLGEGFVDFVLEFKFSFDVFTEEVLPSIPGDDISSKLI
jgi:hypothetical protein